MTYKFQFYRENTATKCVQLFILIKPLFWLGKTICLESGKISRNVWEQGNSFGLASNLNILFIISAKILSLLLCVFQQSQTHRPTGRQTEFCTQHMRINWFYLFLTFVHDFLVSNQISSKKLFVRSFVVYIKRRQQLACDERCCCCCYKTQ